MFSLFGGLNIFSLEKSTNIHAVNNSILYMLKQNNLKCVQNIEKAVKSSSPRLPFLDLCNELSLSSPFRQIFRMCFYSFGTVHLWLTVLAYCTEKAPCWGQWWVAFVSQQHFHMSIQTFTVILVRNSIFLLTNEVTRNFFQCWTSNMASCKYTDKDAMSLCYAFPTSVDNIFWVKRILFWKGLSGSILHNSNFFDVI